MEAQPISKLKAESGETNQQQNDKIRYENIFGDGCKGTELTLSLQI